MLVNAPLPARMVFGMQLYKHLHALLLRFEYPQFRVAAINMHIVYVEYKSIMSVFNKKAKTKQIGEKSRETIKFQFLGCTSYSI